MRCKTCAGRGGYNIGPQPQDFRQCKDCRGTGETPPIQLELPGIRGPILGIEEALPATDTRKD